MQVPEQRDKKTKGKFRAVSLLNERQRYADLDLKPSSATQPLSDLGKSLNLLTLSLLTYKTGLTPNPLPGSLPGLEIVQNLSPVSAKKTTHQMVAVVVK